MKTEKRLSLADFKLAKQDSVKELDKLLGGAAAQCHGKCTVVHDDDVWLDYLDYSIGTATLKLSDEQYKLMQGDDYNIDKDEFFSPENVGYKP